jgi:hypothetical protein
VELSTKNRKPITHWAKTSKKTQPTICMACINLENGRLINVPHIN